MAKTGLARRERRTKGTATEFRNGLMLETHEFDWRNSDGSPPFSAEQTFSATCRRGGVLYAAVLGVVLLGFPALGQIADPPAALEHLRAGLAARDEKRFDDAARELETAIGLAPDVAEIHLNLGLVYHESSRFLEAATSFRRALTLQPDLRGVERFLGFALLSAGNFEAAAEHLERAREEDPGDASVSAWLGLAYLRSGEPEKAIPRLGFAREKKPGDLDLLF